MEELAECSFFGQRKQVEEEWSRERGGVSVFKGGGKWRGRTKRRGPEREEGEGTVLPFTLEAFGLFFG